MTLTDVLEKIVIPLIAACVGAILAFRYQTTIELKRDKRHIIQTLMMYRNVGASELSFIEALNAVDIVYHNNKKVRVLLHSFFAQVKEPYFSNYQWKDTFYEMLFEMAQSSGYSKLSKNDIRNYYAPIGLDLHYPSTVAKRQTLGDASTPESPEN